VAGTLRATADRHEVARASIWGPNPGTPLPNSPSLAGGKRALPSRENAEELRVDAARNMLNR
jgi:hypothetical protein